MYLRKRGILVISLLFLLAAVPAGVAVADTSPNDPGFIAYSPALKAAGLTQAWDVTEGSPSVTIAIVDTGVNPDPDLVPNLIPGYSVDGSANTTDNYGHGTAMASIAGAVINNGIGVAGACGKCQILPIKLNPGEPFGTASFTTAQIAAGINLAVQHGAKVINLSLGTDAGDSSVNAAIANAIAQGIVVVIGAGNGFNDNGQGTDQPTSNFLAAENPEAIIVANFNNVTGQLDSSSNYGPWIDLAAPGTYLPLILIPGFHRSGGTSSAAALVSGIAGLLLSYNPSLTPAQVKQILDTSGTPEPGLNVSSGKLVSAYQALIAAGYNPPPTPPPTPPQMIRLKLNIVGKGSVVVTGELSAVCSHAQCSYSYLKNQALFLSARAGNSQVFAGWQGGCRGKSRFCQLKMAQPYSVTAVFAKPVKKK